MLTQMCCLSCKDVRRHALQPTHGTAILPHVSSSCRQAITTPTESDISLSHLPPSDLRHRRSTRLACSEPFARCHQARPSIFDDGEPFLRFGDLDRSPARTQYCLLQRSRSGTNNTLGYATPEDVSPSTYDAPYTITLTSAGLVFTEAT